MIFLRLERREKCSTPWTHIIGVHSSLKVILHVFVLPYSLLYYVRPDRCRLFKATMVVWLLSDSLSGWGRKRAYVLNVVFFGERGRLLQCLHHAYGTRWKMVTWPIVQVIFQKRVRVFHRGFQTRENWWKHEALGGVLLLFSSVWKPRWNTKHEFLK